MHFRLLQLKDSSKYGFMDFDFALRHGFSLDDYKCTYEMEVDSDHDLDDFFVMFNLDRPADFKGHSLSVSDIIDLDGHYHYCNGVGWEELSPIDLK